MRQFVTSGLLWFSAIGCGLLAGVYFAFSTFIMTALAAADPARADGATLWTRYLKEWILWNHVWMVVVPPRSAGDRR